MLDGGRKALSRRRRHLASPVTCLQARSSEKEEDSENLLDEALSSKLPDWLKNAVNKAVDTVDGTGLTGDALGHAFNEVKKRGKAVEFIQNTVIDTVDKAMVILTMFRGFEFSQDCPTPEPPTIGISGYNIKLNPGRLRCSVTLVGKTITLFDTPWSNGDLMPLPSPPLDILPGAIRDLANTPLSVLAKSPVNSIKSLMAMGQELMHCQHFESGEELTKCLGSQIIDRVPPLSHLNRLGEVMAETIEAFAKVATALAKKSLKGGTSLIQKATWAGSALMYIAVHSSWCAFVVLSCLLRFLPGRHLGLPCRRKDACASPAGRSDR